MRFKINPQLILTKDEFETLDDALKLCRDMDEQTSACGCDICPFQEGCTQMCSDCVYAVAHNTLKKIIDIAIVK